jgi:hypothetical protein
MNKSNARCAQAVLSVLLLSVLGQSAARAALVYAVGTGHDSGVYTADFGSGTVSELFGTAKMKWADAADGDARHPNTFYATANNAKSLYRVDVVDETVTAVGSYGGAHIKGLAYDAKRDILYGTDYKKLYTIDILPSSDSEGAATLIGKFKKSGKAELFNYDALTDELVVMTKAGGKTRTYTIDRDTGEAEFAGFGCGALISDIWYDADSGEMFGIGSGLPDQGGLYRIDVATGELVQIGSTEYDLLGLGRPQAVPEPATIVLLCLGGITIVRRKIKSGATS